jgi:hypothetical protein
MSRAMYSSFVIVLVSLTYSPTFGSSPPEALAQQSRLQFTDTPLVQIVGFLSDMHNTTVVLDPRVDGNELITADTTGRLEVLLAETLRPLNLTYRVQDQAIIIAPTDVTAYTKRLRDRAKKEHVDRDLEQHARREMVKENVQTRWVEDRRGYVAEVKIRGAGVSDASLAAVKTFRHLTCLDLNGTRITDRGLEQLSGMERLSVLRLAGTKISDAGLRHLVALPTLIALDLSDTEITDEGLLILGDVRGLQGILIEDTLITANGIANLREKLPQIRVFTDRRDVAKPPPPGVAQDPFGLPNLQLERWFPPDD